MCCVELFAWCPLFLLVLVWCVWPDAQLTTLKLALKQSLESNCVEDAMLHHVNKINTTKMFHFDNDICIYNTHTHNQQWDMWGWGGRTHNVCACPSSYPALPSSSSHCLSIDIDIVSLVVSYCTICCLFFSSIGHKCR